MVRPDKALPSLRAKIMAEPPEAFRRQAGQPTIDRLGAYEVARDISHSPRHRPLL